MRVFQGTIITVDKNNAICKYLVEDGGRIVYVGDELPEEYRYGRIIDLGEGALMPAFADTHSHFVSYAMLSTTIKLDKAASNTEIKEILAKADKEYPEGKTLLCFGATPKVAEGRLIEKKELAEAVKSKRAVVVICGDGHTCVLNDTALAKMPKSLAKLRGCHWDTGIMNQEAFYKAAGSLIKLISIRDALQAFQSAIDLYIAKGVGLICCECSQGFPFDIDVRLIKWIYKGQLSGIQMRLFVQSFNPKKAKKFGLPRLGGCFETAPDGSITSSDAALCAPYEGTDNKGVLYYTDAELYERIDKINRAGLQLQMHAIGDAAVEQGARILQKALDAYPRDDHRHALIHVSLISENAMNILQRYKIQVVGQPAFIGLSEENFDFMYSKLGERVYDAEPHSEFVKRGILFSASSDAPVTFPDPIRWVHWMVNNPNTKHRVLLADAIRVCTYNGYSSTFDEKVRGSLEEGKIADMIILDKNPFGVPQGEIKDIKVLSTYLGGREFRPDSESIYKTIMRGVCSKNTKI